MKANDLYKSLETDFEFEKCSDDWPDLENNKFVSESFKKTHMGLVLDNAEVVEKVYTAVFPSQKILDKVLEKDQQNILLFVHHPMVWDIRRAPKIFEFINNDYLQNLKRQRVAVFAMHVPLDKNSEYSTSTTLAKKLRLELKGEFYEYFGVNVGVFGKTSFSNISQLNEKFEEVVGHKTKAYNYGSQEIKDQKVGVIGGGGLDVQALDELKNLGINTFVTGITINNEHSKKAHEIAKDYKINILGGTHYSTEKFACIKMCEYFQKKGLESEFLEDDPVLEDM